MICKGSSFPWRNRLASSGDPPESDMVGGNPHTSKKYLLFLWQINKYKRLYLAFFVRLAFNTMSLSGGSPLYETRFLHGNDEPLHILSAAFYPPYELC